MGVKALFQVSSSPKNILLELRNIEICFDLFPNALYSLVWKKEIHSLLHFPTFLNDRKIKQIGTSLERRVKMALLLNEYNNNWHGHDPLDMSYFRF